MSDTSDLTKGTIMKHKEGLWQVQDKTLVDQARGSAVVRVKLKNLEDGHIEEETFPSGDQIDIAHIKHVDMQYLYQEDNRLAFMNQETYETIEINEDILGDESKYLKEELEVVMKTYEGKPVSMILPDKISYEVIQAPPAVKGDSASGSTTKTVTLENGMKVDVPVFIEKGDEVYVNTNSGEYDQRVN